MNKRVKKLWLDALRSGTYEQVTNGLTDGKGFCCLGVLCNLHALKVGKTWVDNNESLEYMGQSSVLPATVSKWARFGISEFNPLIRHPDTGNLTTLAGLNDNGYTFKQIADLIEEQL